ncbi:TIR domain-containing protein [Sinorhizobium chiapasense]|uniref:TIR domain-containing protein n=1 Tax=Sinorhizobium chiapasense TaxID=501572 RepID=A0ABZ2BJK6_9HYPH
MVSWNNIISETPVRRKVFISYYHGGDQRYYEDFSNSFGKSYEVFSDRSLDRARDSGDPEYIIRYIRENHLSGSSTLIVLCGLQTAYRKYVDWEIAAGLRREMALVGIKLPSLPVVNDASSKPARLQDNIDSGYAEWIWWENAQDVNALRGCIERANGRRKALIQNFRPRMVRNG